ncbi:MAG: hypothetical protein AB2697_21700 [Candidatus Thiodiazotropha endolucinida]
MLKAKQLGGQMSYSYMLVRLKEQIGNFKEFHEENVIALDTDLEDIKSIIYKIVPNIEWSQQDECTIFGSIPCRLSSTLPSNVEVWVIGNPVCALTISGIEENELISIGNLLKMTIVDVQTGEVVGR